MKRLLALGLVMACCFPHSALATKFAGEFMAVGGGGRALGMGGAFVAVGGDASTVYWNPAGVSETDGRQAIAMHSERFGELVNYNFAAYTQPASFIDFGEDAAIGFALIHLGVDDIVVTNQLGFMDLNGDGIFQPQSGEFLTDADGNEFNEFDSLPTESDNSFALFNTVAVNTKWGRVGGTLKLIYTDAIAGVSSTGVGIDLGFLRRDVLVERFDVGVKLQDATGTYLSWSTGTNEFVAPSVSLGAAYRYPAPSLNASLMLAADLHTFYDDRQGASQYWQGAASADLHLGAEIAFQERVMVRGGLDSGNPTTGAGLRIGFLGFDYAYLHHDDFDATHRVSVQAGF